MRFFAIHRFLVALVGIAFLAILAANGDSITFPAHSAECRFKFQCSRTVEAPKSHAITNQHRQRIGDVYDPSHGRRLQIRNNHRQIIGYIERDGTVSNTSRQRVGTLEEL